MEIVNANKIAVGQTYNNFAKCKFCGEEFTNYKLGRSHTYYKCEKNPLRRDKYERLILRYGRNKVILSPIEKKNVEIMRDAIIKYYEKTNIPLSASKLKCLPAYRNSGKTNTAFNKELTILTLLDKRFWIDCIPNQKIKYKVKKKIYFDDDY